MVAENDGDHACLVLLVVVSDVVAGFCNKKNECKFIHDSRRVAMCRKFLRNECTDPNCLLSHQNDEVRWSRSKVAMLWTGCADARYHPPGLGSAQNKVPVCALFLRGICTRDGCKYRHVKVSATAAVCPDFVKGYCIKGDACPLKHELSKRKRTLSAVAKRPNTLTNGANGLGASPGKSLHSVVKKKAAASTSASSALPSSTNVKANAGLSLRPNIRFAPKHGAVFPSLFDEL